MRLHGLAECRRTYGPHMEGVVFIHWLSVLLQSERLEAGTEILVSIQKPV